MGSRTLRYYTERTETIRELNKSIEVNWMTAKTKTDKISFDPDKVNKIITTLNEKL